MAVNEVTMNGETLISLVNDTVTEASLLSGETAHDASGAQITGKAKYINPNLLINPDFSINQRGKTEYTEANQYTVDMWLWSSADGKVVVNSDGVTVTAGDSTGYFIQYFENPYIIDGQDITITVTDGDGSTHTGTGYMPEGDSSSSFVIPVVITFDNGCMCRLVKKKITSGSQTYLQFDVLAGLSISLKKVKLELGKLSTPDNDTDKALETLKCQRYYLETAGAPIFGVGAGTNKIRLQIPINAKMRVNPSASLECYNNLGTWELVVIDTTDGSKQTITDVPTIAFNRMESTMLNCTLTFSTDVVAANRVYALMAQGEMRFRFDAGL